MLKEYIRRERNNFNPDVIRVKLNTVIMNTNNLPANNLDDAALICKIQSQLLDIQNCLMNRNPIGVLLADKIDGQVKIGFSLCNKKDRYTKKEAEEKAIEKMQFGTYKIPQSIQKHFERFLRRSELYFHKNDAKME